MAQDLVLSFSKTGSSVWTRLQKQILLLKRTDSSNCIDNLWDVIRMVNVEKASKALLKVYAYQLLNKNSDLKGREWLMKVGQVYYSHVKC